MKKVLIIGDPDRAALAIIRNLKNDFFIGLVRFDQYSPTFKSKFVNKYYECFKYWNVKILRKCIHDILSKEEYDVLLPVTDSALLFLETFREDFKNYILAIPSENSFKFALNKYELFKIAKEIGFDVPNSFLIKNFENYLKIKSKLKFPLIAKPISSVKIIDDYIVNFKVEIVYNENDLEEIFSENLHKIDYLLQEKVKGIGVGYECLAENGEIVNFFAHKRIHEPFNGGGSSYRKSISKNKEIYSKFEKLVNLIRWNGPMMLEFKYDQINKKYYVMELNGRYWGSLPLVINAKMNLPFNHIKMLLNEKNFYSNSYILNIRQRHLLKDVKYIVGILFYKKNVRLFIKEIFELLKSLFDKNHFFDLEDKKDFLPAIYSYFYFFKMLLNKLLKKIKIFYFKIKCSFGKFRLRKILADRNINKILFICKGNINRSPFAEQYLKKKSKEKNLNIQILSAGYIFNIKRKSPPIAIKAAKSFGVNLTNHYSKLLDETMIKESDLIFIMDIENYYYMKEKYPMYLNKVFLLAKFLNKCEIKDPYKQDLKFYKNVYLEIVNSINIFIEGFISENR